MYWLQWGSELTKWLSNFLSLEDDGYVFFSQIVSLLTTPVSSWHVGLDCLLLVAGVSQNSKFLNYVCIPVLIISPLQ